jgi:oligopeptide/dipeptide ABC transporter ATP-binding protein
MNNMSQNMAGTNDYLLTVDNLKTYFPIRKGLLRRTVGYIKAVDGVSFKVRSGQVLGLVGESGCGKTTVARTLLRLVPATAGRVVFGETDVLSADKPELRRIRREISLIFQDPYGSLNPRMTIGDIVAEPLKVHGGRAGQVKRRRGNEMQRVAALLSKVGLSPEHINRYPHEFSGGQRQRIGIARALVLEPKMIICDEPVSALDVSIQSQILNLLKDLQDEFGLTFVFIAHDLAVVQFFCDVVAVMYMGRIVEQADSEELYQNALHPYTQALISAIPQVAPAHRGQREGFGGEVPSAVNPPSGCRFHPRCPLAETKCRREVPPLQQKGPKAGHFVACWQR